MKKSILALLAVALIASCTKPKEEEKEVSKPVNEDLYGKWLLDSLSSPDKMKWQDTILFKFYLVIEQNQVKTQIESFTFIPRVSNGVSSVTTASAIDNDVISWGSQSYYYTVSKNELTLVRVNPKPSDTKKKHYKRLE
jgi:hypothetical protein